MQTKTWPYGTVKHATLVAVYQDGAVLMCETDEDPGEMFVLIGKPRADVRATHRGLMTFRQGGPTGGHWEFKPETAQTATPDPRKDSETCSS